MARCRAGGILVSFKKSYVKDLNYFYWKKYPSRFSLIVRLLITLPFGLDMVGNNTLIDDKRPQAPAAADRLGKTIDSGSPQTQKCDIQDVNEDIRQIHKLYHFQNCGIVYMDSFNARGVRMENCGNHVPQVVCS